MTFPADRAVDPARRQRGQAGHRVPPRPEQKANPPRRSRLESCSGYRIGTPRTPRSMPAVDEASHPMYVTMVKKPHSDGAATQVAVRILHGMRD